MAYKKGGAVLPTLTLQIAMTRRFELDCALYGLTEEALLRAREILVADPAVGHPYVDNVALWSWQHAGYDVIYAISGDFSKLVLLELRPHVEVPGKMIERILSTIDRVNAIKRLFGI
ncbi:hypothetical protein [Aureimonas sp. SA4125]|uniref:hypothetical protein n=1 Tax=Aureimonas sp. SA4125 TaxID=2826993 RepID=UPI001CC451B8|nr:hypothetical protein [Aureimonas sp. SA4125]